MKTHSCRLIATLFLAASLPLPAQDLKDLQYRESLARGGQLEGLSLYDRSHAVVVGISNYQSLAKLPGAVRDAESVAEILGTHGFEVQLITDAEATRLRIAEVLGDRLPAYLEPEDRVLVYFAGHGLTVGPSEAPLGYLMPVEGDNDRRVATGISMAELQRWFAGYRAKHVMFVADACYSGLALATRSAGLPSTLADYLEQVTQKRVQIALTAGRADQEAHEWRGHGLFTFFLLDALRGAGDSNRDGILTSSELYAYVEPAVAQTALANWRAEQSPQLGRMGQGEFVFLVGAPASTDEPVAEPLETGTADQETAFWNSIANSVYPEDLQAYLERYPQGAFRALASLRLERLRTAEDATRGGTPADEPAPPLPAEAEGPPALAVLPFENRAGPDDAYFSDGITEDVITQLSKISALRVAPRASVMAYRDTSKPLPQIAQELQVTVLLQGSVRRAGNRVRITGQLVDVHRNQNLWAESFDRDLDDVFAIQSEVAQKIAAALEASLTSGERERIEKRPTRDLNAYDLYLRGRDYYYRYREEDNDLAVKLFENALEQDPSFALAWAGLADALAQQVQRYGRPPAQLERALEAAERAVTIDPGLAEGHKALGLAYTLRGWTRKALEANLRTVQLNPNHAEAIGNIAFLQIFTGRPNEATVRLERLRELIPNQPFPYSGSGFLHLFLDDPEQARPWFERAFTVVPGFPDAHVGLIYLDLLQGNLESAREEAAALLARLPSDAEALAWAGDVELFGGRLAQARALYEKSLAQSVPLPRRAFVSRPSLPTLLAYIHLEQGEPDRAREYAEQASRQARAALEAGADIPGLAYDLACLYAGQHQETEALQWLRSASDSGFVLHRALRQDPIWQALAESDGFRELAERLADKVRDLRAPRE